MPRKFRDPLELKEEMEQREKASRERENQSRDDKPSWRELDAKRDRSAHVSDSKPKEPHSSRLEERKRRGEALAKKALDQLFSGKKGKEQNDAWKHVCEATGSLFSRRATTYVEQYGVPRDWDDLLRLLDHNETQFVSTLLDRMIELAPQETESKHELLKGKLRVLKMTAEDPALIEKFDRSMEAISGLG